MPVFNIQLAAQGKTPDGKTVNVPPQIALLQRGPIVPVMVCLEANMAKPLMSQGQAIVSHGGLALIDTGAVSSAIDEEVAQKLGLPVVDTGKMGSASHENHPCNFYPVQITLGGKLVLQVPHTLGAKLKSQGLVALIGRDVLQQCTFIYNGSMGSITLAM